MGGAPLTESVAHSLKVLSQVPIVTESGLAKMDRSFCHSAKCAVITLRGNLHHLIALQEHEFEEILFSERH